MDYNPGDTLYFEFTSVDADGAPVALADSPAVQAHKNADVTQTTDGLTLTTGFDGITGLNGVTVDTSANGTFYAAGSTIRISLSAGTADGVSVVGYVVGRFTLAKQTAKLANGVTHGGSTGVLQLQKVVVASTGNDPAVSLTGSGSGSGLFTTGGNTSGHGLRLLGGTGGCGLYCVSGDNGDGAYFEGAGSSGGQYGMMIIGNGDSPALLCQGDTNGTGALITGGIGGMVIRTTPAVGSGHALEIIGGGVDKHGVYVHLDTTNIFSNGNGIRVDVSGSSSATEGAVYIQGVTPDGTGLHVGGGSGSTGHSIHVDGQLHVMATTGDAVVIESNGGNGAGLSINGNGSSAGVISNGFAGNLVGNVTGSVGLLGTQAKADVNAEVLDVLNVDTFAEPSGTPAATTTFSAKVGWVYMALRNKLDVTGSAKKFYDDAGNVEWQKALSDDGSTYSEAEASAP